MNKPILAVIIPCYNEELCVKKTAETLLALLDKLVKKEKISEESYLYFVDDGSKDKTWNIIVSLHQLLLQGLKVFDKSVVIVLFQLMRTSNKTKIQLKSSLMNL